MIQPDDDVYLISVEEFDRWRSRAQAQAIATGISVAEVDWFLQALTSVTALDLKLGLSKTLESQKSLATLTALWQKRVEQRVPVQYLVGKAPWRNFELVVTPAVLIPRPETEYLLDLAQQTVNQLNPVNPDLAMGHWVDLGTGSGAIALGLAELFPAAKLHAVDQSAAALDIARQNAQAYNFMSRIKFYQGNWWEPLAHLQGKLSGMISNPPYIPALMLPDLQSEVYQHEPHSALDGGIDGLKDIRILVDEAPKYLISGGIWLIEMMRGQGQAVATLLEQNRHYTQIQVLNDFSGGDRYVLAQRR